MDDATLLFQPQGSGFGEPSSESRSAKKKRKQRSADTLEEVRESSKSARFDQLGEGSEEYSAWKNLQLILLLQDKNTDLQKKVHLAFNYVKSSSVEDTDDISGRSQVLDTSRTIIFLNNWVQSVLISSGKKMRLEEGKPQLETYGSVLDLRCWKIFQFCLEELKKLHMSLSCSKDFLLVIHSIAMDASSCLNDVSCERAPSNEQSQIYDVVVDCIAKVFSTHGGVANENLDLWVLLMDKMLELTLKIVAGQLNGSKIGNFILQLSCYLFEPFVKFLRVHPVRKSGFQNFIDKLLEPLLHLLHVLHSGSCGRNNEWITKLPKLVEEVLAEGLFHPTHIDGFLGLQSTLRYKESSDVTVKEEKLVNKSYHRHLFDKVEKMIAKKNGLALNGLGELLHFFVGCVTKHRGDSVAGGAGQSQSNSTSVNDKPNQSRAMTSEMSPLCHSMNAELRKCTFDFCVQFLEYLLADLSKILQPKGKLVSELFDITSTLKSINTLLASIIRDKLYLRTEDTTEGASRNFLRSIYAMLMSLSAKIGTPFLGDDGKWNREVFVSIRTEIIVCVHHLLNIEYEAVGDDLESLWTMVISSAACCFSSMEVPGQPLMFSEILGLSCRLVDLYSELRQVDASIFALCRAVRHSSLIMVDSEEHSSSSICSSYSSSLSMLFSSSDFRVSLSNAIKAIPEGQASACLRRLSLDIKESLEWVKFGHQLRAELLGKVLSEAYSIILDSVTVTSGNSYLVGGSLKNLTEIMQPSLSGLVSKQPDSSKEFSVLVEGRILSKSTGADNVTMCWILVLFFRLVLSCRSLFRQAISLMPPDASKKMSGVMGDTITVHSGRDWLEMTICADKGYFSWILQPSATLLSVVRAVSDICIKNSDILCAPLVYVLNALSLQRLADLNRLIQSSEYMLQWTQTSGQTKLKDGGDPSCHHERIRKWSKYVTKMRTEAAGLTELMMESISIAKDQKSSSSVNDEIDETLISGQHNNDASNIAVGSLDEKSLASILWWIICKNVDIWCSHATKKHAKNFLSRIINASLSSVNNNDDQFGKRNMSKTGHLKKVTPQQIALEFLSNTISYEQRFVRRYMASRFCRILQKSVHSIFTKSEVDLSESPDWNVAISAVENLPNLDSFPQTKRDVVPAESCNEQLDVGFDRCHFLLTLLMRMPEEYLRLKSSSLYITYIINLERLLVGSMSGWGKATCSQNNYQVFQLFVTCRKVLHILAAASSKENANGSNSPLCSFPLLWLLKSLSAAIVIQHALPDDIVIGDKVTIFSLVDHTSNVLLKVSRGQFESAFSSLVSVRKLHRKRKGLDPCATESDLSGSSLSLNPSENSDACQSVLNLVKALEEDLQKSLAAFGEVSLDKKVECLARFQDFNKLSSTIACCQGLFWGLASTLGDTKAVNGNLRTKSCYDSELMTRIKSCADTCVHFMTSFLKALFLEDDSTLDMSSNGSNGLEARKSSSGKYDGSMDKADEDCPTEKMALSDIKGDLTKRQLKRKSSLALPDLEAFLTKVQHQKLYLKKSLLMQVFEGGSAEAAFFLRQLFIACSAIVRLNLQIEITSSSWSLFVIVVNISEFLLLEFSRCEMPHQFAFFCLDGVVKFLEELGSYFPLFDSSSSRDVYVKLIGLHLQAIGKCICLQGKEAKLASQETGLPSKLADAGSRCSWVTSRLCELKERLRISFRKYVSKSSELHLLSAIQAIERALAGVQEGLMTNYEIVCGNSNGGEVSSIVAAGIDALDLIVEFVIGPRRLNMIKKHIQNLVACLSNIIIHLQGPGVFKDTVKDYKRPNSGSVMLMCIEILTKISAKPSLFQIDSTHIAQSLRIPGSLFQYFLRLQNMSETSLLAAVDHKISGELYAACCRNLCTALKHHRSETHQCIALLEDSVSALLHSLETVNTDGVAGKESASWEVQEAVICASSLRRVYEEIRQQKDVFGQCSFQFLSRYIWVYCGLGPSRKGIIREVDEALKPGLYALIDTCSADDLQLLHTVFGEGPCRSTLASLQHDYKVNFQFGGKV